MVDLNMTARSSTVEHLALVQAVAGSIPVARSKFYFQKCKMICMTAKATPNTDT